MALLELFSPWFNGQYVYLVPIVLLAEEIGLAYAFGRVGGID
jgi:hypothetical protein